MWHHPYPTRGRDGDTWRWWRSCVAWPGLRPRRCFAALLVGVVCVWRRGGLRWRGICVEEAGVRWQYHPMFLVGVFIILAPRVVGVARVWRRDAGVVVLVGVFIILPPTGKAKLTIVLRGCRCRQQADDHQQAEQRRCGGLAAALLHFLLPHAERSVPPPEG